MDGYESEISERLFPSIILELSFINFKIQDFLFCIHLLSSLNICSNLDFKVTILKEFILSLFFYLHYYQIFKVLT